MRSSSALRILFQIFVCSGAATTSAYAQAAPDDTDDSADVEERPNSAESTSRIEANGDGEEQVASNVPSKRNYRDTDKSFGHKGQFNVRLGVGLGYRVVMRYDKSPECSTARDDNGFPVKMCGYVSPLMLDAAVGYAVTGSFEPFLWGRFGLAQESDSHTAPLVMLGVGARLYTIDDSAFKLAIEPAVGIELEGAATDTYARMYEYKRDLIVRLGIGPQYDFSRNIGIFATAGLTAGMFRAIHTWLDLHAGVQARFP
ncbi:MAG TPA: hypothetical protein VKP30_10655 [Polyangiaceae bacterium]|nr:hypothetical protein [Polyangiaceae bacterium]